VLTLYPHQLAEALSERLYEFEHCCAGERADPDHPPPCCASAASGDPDDNLVEFTVYGR